MVKRFLLAISLFLSAALAGVADIDSSERIFNPYFRTLKTFADDNMFAPAVIRLGTLDRLIVSFDEIGEDNSYLEYRLIHCNSDWQPSRLVESEYIDGFNSARIEDYEYSSNTYVHYVNYRIEIPNEEVDILHSGNYLLQVYDPDEPDETILQTRFRVTEGLVKVAGTANSRTDRGHNSEWQQLAIAVDYDGFTDLNPFQDITLEIIQNSRDATRRELKSPIRVNGNTAIYDHVPALIYPASNEYRRFESVSNSFPGMHVDSLHYMGSNYHVWLKPDERRDNSQYQYDRTQNGRFLVREYNATNSDVGADYITVHFMLEFPELINADLYLDGEFTHNRFDDFNRMTYDREARVYRAQVPLKQGAYNYQYVAIPRDASTPPTPALVEGNKYETDNEYTVAVYFHPPGARAERLIGFAVIHPFE